MSKPSESTCGMGATRRSAARYSPRICCGESSRYLACVRWQPREGSRSRSPHTGTVRYMRPGRALEQTAILPDWGAVSPRYFDTLQIPLVRGRAFEDRDRQGANGVIILNETMANRLFRGADPVGQTVIHRSGPPPGEERALEVVGVARDGKYRTLGDRLVRSCPCRRPRCTARSSGSSLVPSLAPAR